MPDVRTKRHWSNTSKKLDLIVRRTGLTRIKQVDACVHAWNVLDRERRDQAILNSDQQRSEGVSLGLWPSTFAAIDEISRTTGMSESVKVIDVIVEAWALLTPEEKAQAIELASANEAQEATP